jgi:hypothetical protein
MKIILEIDDTLSTVLSVVSDNPDTTLDKTSAKLISTAMAKFYSKPRKSTATTIVCTNVSDITTIRQQYDLTRSGNPYLQQFAKHQQQFYASLSHRVSNNLISTDDISEAFSVMASSSSFSLMQFLNQLGNTSPKYTKKHILVDFIYIMLDGKVSSHSMECKGIKTLLEWLDSGIITSIEEIEDCFLWMPISGRAYKLSYVSLVSAMSEFDRVKVINNFGRFTGNQIGNKSKDDVTRERLSSRNYNTVVDKAKTASANRKTAIANLMGVE